MGEDTRSRAAITKDKNIELWGVKKGNKSVAKRMQKTLKLPILFVETPHFTRIFFIIYGDHPRPPRGED
jgi:hypothetical protein